MYRGDGRPGAARLLPVRRFRQRPCVDDEGRDRRTRARSGLDGRIVQHLVLRTGQGRRALHRLAGRLRLQDRRRLTKSPAPAARHVEIHPALVPLRLAPQPADGGTQDGSGEGERTTVHEVTCPWQRHHPCWIRAAGPPRMILGQTRVVNRDSSTRPHNHQRRDEDCQLRPGWHYLSRRRPTRNQLRWRCDEAAGVVLFVFAGSQLEHVEGGEVVSQLVVGREVQVDVLVPAVRLVRHRLARTPVLRVAGRQGAEEQDGARLGQSRPLPERTCGAPAGAAGGRRCRRRRRRRRPVRRPRAKPRRPPRT